MNDLKNDFNKAENQENKNSIHNHKGKLIYHIKNFIMSKLNELIDINSLINVIIGDSEYNKTYYKYFAKSAILVNIVSMGIFLFTCIFNFLVIDDKKNAVILWLICMASIVLFDIKLYLCIKVTDNLMINMLNLYKLIYFVIIGGNLLYYTLIFVINIFKTHKNIASNWFGLSLSLIVMALTMYVIAGFSEYIILRKKYKKELYIKSYKDSNKISVTLYIVSFIFLLSTLILSLCPYMISGQINGQLFSIGITATILIVYSLIIIFKNYYFFKDSSFKLVNIGNVFISILPVIFKFISDVLEKQMK